MVDSHARLEEATHPTMIVLATLPISNHMTSFESDATLLQILRNQRAPPSCRSIHSCDLRPMLSIPSTKRAYGTVRSQADELFDGADSTTPTDQKRPPTSTAREDHKALKRTTDTVPQRRDAKRRSHRAKSMTSRRIEVWHRTA